MAVAAVDPKAMEKKTGMKEAEIIRILTEIGMPTERKDGNLVVEITPNRPDLFPMEGMVRTLLAYKGGKVPEYKVLDGGYRMKVGKGVESARPFVRCAVVKGVRFDDESVRDAMQMQEKLHETVGRKRKKVAVGLHNLDAIKFPLEYVVGSGERFVPLETSEEMGLGEVLDKHPKGIAYAHLSRDAKVVIKDAEGVISYPPIINSERTKVNGDTKNLLIDVTGTSGEAVEGVLNIIATAFADAGAEIYSVEIGGERYPKLDYRKIGYDEDEVRRVLGNSVGKKEAKTALRRMGYKVKADAIYAPPYRVDIISFIDVIEDIAVGHGYTNFMPELPQLPTIGSWIPGESDIHEIMCGMGFLEAKTYVLSNDKLLADTPDRGRVRIANSTSEEFGTVRTSLIPGLLGTCKTNKTRGLPQRFYELGGVWNGGEEKRLAFVMIGQDAKFSRIQSALQTFAKEWGAELSLKPAEDGRFISGRCYSIHMDGKEAGVMGEVSPKVLGEFELEYPVAACEIMV
ncbi:MAG: phenylalanine--tRNA ligase subunit beta [Candidatus ainarchaeum sp.]|nr:phenylalanine--tRNA ligase subunit beta [Candidatus ainarchaeum sp.]